VGSRGDVCIRYTRTHSSFTRRSERVWNQESCNVSPVSLVTRTSTHLDFNLINPNSGSTCPNHQSCFSTCPTHQSYLLTMPYLLTMRSLLLILTASVVYGFAPHQNTGLTTRGLGGTKPLQRTFCTHVRPDTTALHLAPAPSAAALAAITGAITGGFAAGGLHAIAGKFV
jgi:hypothetical protein